MSAVETAAELVNRFDQTRTAAPDPLMVAHVEARDSVIRAEARLVVWREAAEWCEARSMGSKLTRGERALFMTATDHFRAMATPLEPIGNWTLLTAERYPIPGQLVELRNEYGDSCVRAFTHEDRYAASRWVEWRLMKSAGDSTKGGDADAGAASDPQHVASPADSTSTKGEHLCWCGKPVERARPSWCGDCDPLDDDRVAALAALARACPVTPADLDALRTEILERVATACDRIDKAQDVVEGLVRAMSRAP